MLIEPIQYWLVLKQNMNKISLVFIGFDLRSISLRIRPHLKNLCSLSKYLKCSSAHSKQAPPSPFSVSIFFLSVCRRFRRNFWRRVVAVVAVVGVVVVLFHVAVARTAFHKILWFLYFFAWFKQVPNWQQLLSAALVSPQKAQLSKGLSSLTFYVVAIPCWHQYMPPAWVPRSLDTLIKSFRTV